MVCEIDGSRPLPVRLWSVGMSTGLVFSSCSLSCDRTCSAEIPTRDHPSAKELKGQVTVLGV